MIAAAQAIDNLNRIKHSLLQSFVQVDATIDKLTTYHCMISRH